MSWASIILTVLKLVTWIMKARREQQSWDDGRKHAHMEQFEGLQNELREVAGVNDWYNSLSADDRMRLRENYYTH